MWYDPSVQIWSVVVHFSGLNCSLEFHVQSKYGMLTLNIVFIDGICLSTFKMFLIIKNLS